MLGAAPAHHDIADNPLRRSAHSPALPEGRPSSKLVRLGLGEGWHNTHHAFPTSARHGLRWWQIDASYGFIRALALLGLAWNVKVPEKQAQAAQRT
jgi:stearoyl-CoA desaturase (delta-9 desaturase)